MKVVVCRECGDWVKLTGETRYCRCGRSGGAYLPDDVNAVVFGPCFPVAIRNSEFPHKGKGSWLILDPENPESHVRFETLG